jgi:hypothetical protein
MTSVLAGAGELTAVTAAGPPNNRLQRTALRAAAEAAR